MIEIIRVDRNDRRTLGVLFVGSKLICFTLEPEWKDNQKFKSCIPAGEYTFIKYNSKKYGRECIGVNKVDDRKYIAIHPGNLRRETKGCILPGEGLGEWEEGDYVFNSARALNRILSKIEGDSGTLIIKDNYLRG